MNEARECTFVWIFKMKHRVNDGQVSTTPIPLCGYESYCFIPEPSYALLSTYLFRASSLYFWPSLLVPQVHRRLSLGPPASFLLSGSGFSVYPSRPFIRSSFRFDSSHSSSVS